MRLGEAIEWRQREGGDSDLVASVEVLSGTPPSHPPAAGLDHGARVACRWIVRGRLIPHLVPMLEEFGLTSQHAGIMIGVLGISVVVGRLMTGWMLDHLFASRAGCEP